MNLLLNFVKSLAPRINFNPPEMICFFTLVFGQALQLTSQTQFSSQNSLPSLSPLESSTWVCFACNTFCTPASTLLLLLRCFIVSDSVRPHRWQPTRLLCPWDSPGKNTGRDCHFLLQCMKVKGESEVTQSYLTLSNPMDYSLPGSSIHGMFQARELEWVAITFSL